MKRRAELQGGVYNFLGKQKTVNAPIKWKSSAKHPVAFLAYITKEEMDILIQKNIYGSLKGKPNKGPFGLPSLQGSGGGSEGAGSDGGGPSGPGGSEGFSTSEGPAPGEAEGMGGPAGGPGGSEGFDSMSGPAGLGTLGQQDTFASDVQDDEEGKSGSGRTSPLGQMAYSMSLANPEKSALEKGFGFVTSPISTIAATIADTQMRGVTAPDDYSQVTESVQMGKPESTKESGGDSFLNDLYNKQRKKNLGILSI